MSRIEFSSPEEPFDQAAQQAFMKKAGEYLNNLYSPTELQVEALQVKQLLANASLKKEVVSDIEWFMLNKQPTFFVMSRDAALSDAEIPDVFADAFKEEGHVQASEPDFEDHIAAIVERMHPSIQQGRVEMDLEIEEERMVWKYLDTIAELNRGITEPNFHNKVALKDASIRVFVENLSKAKSTLLEEYRKQHEDKYVTDIRAYFFWHAPHDADELVFS